MYKTNLGSQIFALAGRKNSGYDIPLHTRLGTEFLILLIALMTYLLLLASSGSLALGHMANKWVAGLENAMTIEIPSKKSAKDDAATLVKNLSTIQGVKSVHILTEEDMGEMLSPWLGNQTSILADLPLPVLISIELKERTESVSKDINNLTRRITPDAIVDAHEDWLGDLLKLTNGLRLTAIVIFGLILFVTALVIAGAVRSRMAIHARELELLHIMGATDKYISRQFIHYIASQSIKGMAFGVIAASLTLIGFVIIGNQSPDTVPKVNLEASDWLIFMLVPLLLLITGMITARRTVFRVLNELP